MRCPIHSIRPVLSIIPSNGFSFGMVPFFLHHHFEDGKIIATNGRGYVTDH